jgi:hypothetical protein
MIALHFSCLRVVTLLQYIGYSFNTKKQQSEHDQFDDSTNWLVEFTHGVAHLLGWKPIMHTYAVAFILSQDPDSVAEMFLTRLACAYYFAGGFNNLQANGNVSSVARVRDWPWH